MVLLFLFWYLILPCTCLCAAVLLIGIIDYFWVIRPLQQKAMLYEKNKDESIHKVGFSAEKARNMGQMDAIVIGSGLGGLTAAALLSRRGYKVVVLEQHDVAGGCTHTFEMNSSNSKPNGKPSAGYEFDVGLHYVGAEVGDRFSPFGYLFSTITQNQLIWNELDTDFDSACISRILATQTRRCVSDSGAKESVSTDAKHIFSVGTDEAYAKRLLERFPKANLQEIKRLNNICRWIELLMPVYCTLKVLPLWLSNIVSVITNLVLIPALSTSTREMIAGCTTDEELIGVISYCYGDYGVPPKRSAFLMHALLAVHFRQGAFYPVGGSSEIAKTIIPTILAAGGYVFVRAPVTEIILSEDRARAEGVLVRGVEIRAPIVISAAGVATTFNKLLCQKPGDGTADQYVERVRSLLLARPYYPNAKFTVDSNIANPVLPDPARALTEKDFFNMLEPSCPMLTLFVGVNRSCEELGATSQNKWVFPHWQHDEAVVSFFDSLPASAAVGGVAATAEETTAAADPFLPVAFVSCASSKDPTWSTRHGPHSAVFECLTMADYDVFLQLQESARANSGGAKAKLRRVLPGNRGVVYEAGKEALEQKLLGVLYEAYPRLHELVQAEAEGRSPPLKEGQEPLHLEVSSGTPLTNNFYIGSNAGEIYGLAHTTTRFNGKFEWLLRPRQEAIPGLFLSGQDVCTAGIAGATAGGFICALTIAPMLMLDLGVNYVINLFLFPFTTKK